MMLKQPLVLGQKTDTRGRISQARVSRPINLDQWPTKHEAILAEPGYHIVGSC